MPDLDDDYLESAATKPAEASGDAGAVKAHPLPDVVQALDRKAAQDALSGSNQNGGPRTGWAGLRIARAVPPGAS